MNANKDFLLKQTLSPILFQPVLITFMVPLYIYVAMRTETWSWKPWAAIAFTYSLSALWAFYVRQYRVYWRGDTVGMHTTNGQADVVILVKDITRVQVETSPQRGRVFRRIAIYAKNPDGSPRWVDVSLKHFVPEDIRKLMNLIHQERPDLTLPKQWI